MSPRFSATCLAVLVVMFALLGCGQGNEITEPAAAPDVRDAAASAAQHMCWGMWDIIVNADTAEVEVIPDRTAEFNASVVRFLQPPIVPIQLVTVQLNPYESDIPSG